MLTVTLFNEYFKLQKGLLLHELVFTIIIIIQKDLLYHLEVSYQIPHFYHKEHRICHSCICRYTIMRFLYAINHFPDKTLYIADTLSRTPLSAQAVVNSTA